MVLEQAPFASLYCSSAGIAAVLPTLVRTPNPKPGTSYRRTLSLTLSLPLTLTLTLSQVPAIGGLASAAASASGGRLHTSCLFAPSLPRLAGVTNGRHPASLPATAKPLPRPAILTNGHRRPAAAKCKTRARPRTPWRLEGKDAFLERHRQQPAFMSCGRAPAWSMDADGVLSRPVLCARLVSRTRARWGCSCSAARQQRPYYAF